MELIGRTFGHIRITHVAGGGGMGAVYAGHHEKLDRKVALKVLHAERRLDAEPRERLLREARALSKLDHPNICRIYDYIASDDIDLLVLEYIDGHTLHKVLHERSLTRTEKLNIAIAVAEVLRAAHRLNILHRDLKPENVMLANNGDIKVLDFGLARDLLSNKRLRSSGAQQALHEPVEADSDDVWFPFSEASLTEPRFGSPRRPFHGTMMGVAIGTPLYMSPEQGRGEDLTTASDMFSFGLLLQTLFTGHEPHPKDLRGRDVIDRVSKGETLPVEGVESDVAALIGRLKQLAPSDRPTALEALTQLRYIADKRKRVIRRSAIAAGVVVAMLAVGWHTMQLSRERGIAERNRADAEEQRAQAENLIEFMLGDLRKKLEPVGRLDILDDVGERALQYVQSIEPEKMSSDQLARNAKALNQLGEVRISQGKLNEALDVFQRSLILAQLAAKRDPSAAKMQLAVATAHFWAGDVYRRQGKLPEALRSYTEYMRMSDDLVARDPESEEYRLESAYGHSSVAAVHELQGDYARALEHLRLTRDVKAALLARKPDSTRQADLARTLNRIGLVLERSGDLRGAHEHYEQEFAMYSKLAALDPKNARWKHRLITSHNYLGRMLEMRGDVAGALEHRRAELSLGKELTARDPENAQWQRNLAIAQMKYGDLLRLNGRPREALIEIRKGANTLDRLLSRTETIETWKRDLVNVRTAEAQAHLAEGKAAIAERISLSAVELLETLPAPDPTTLQDYADAYLTLGDARAALGHLAPAREAWSRAVTALSRQRTPVPEALDITVRTLIRLDRRSEAAPVIERLKRIGYRAPDFLAAIS